MKNALMIAALCTLLPVLAEARTFNIDGIVTNSTGLVTHPDETVVADYPLIGSLGTMTFTLGENALGPVDPMSSILIGAPFQSLPLTATVSIGTFTTGFLNSGPDDELEIESQFVDNSQARFSSRTVGQGVTGETFAGSLRLNFSPLLAAPPTTWQDLYDAIDGGKTLANFSYNGTLQGRFISFGFEQTQAAPVVPLPASAVVLITGLGALGFLRRRRT